MRRAISIAFVAALGVAGLGAPAVHSEEYPGGAEGCTHTGGAAKPCTYKAKRSAGYVANGDFTVVVKRGDKTFTFTPKTHESSCLNAVLKGDDVTVSSKGGRVAAGNPFPAAADSGPSLSSGKPGEGHKDCKK